MRHEHKTLMHALGLMQVYDQLDLPALAGAEFLARRVVVIERAVRVNPKAPDFTGLHKMLEHRLDESGGIKAMNFTAHFAQLAEAEARVLRQQRLYRSELGTQHPVPLLDTDDEDAAEAGRGKTRKQRAAEKKKAAAVGGALG